MIVATWNVNGLRARMGRLREWLAERAPDVVCLQELKLTADDFPHEDLRQLGYEAACVCQQSWNGVAILARTKPIERLTGLPGATDAGARFVSARVGEMDVVSIYVPNGKTVDHVDFGTKLTWLDRLATFLESRPDRDAPIVVGGDVNVCPTELDSYGGEAFRGQIFHTDLERKLIARIQGAGLVDLFRAQHPEDPGFSFWDYRAGSFHKKQGMRIDMLYASDPIAKRVSDVYVDREYRKKSKTSGAVPSDHAPVVAVW